MLPKVYLASKLKHAEMLRGFTARWGATIRVTSRWLNMTHLEMDDIRNQPQELYTWCWVIDVNDVMQSNYLVIYGEPGDQLRGACVEAGIALGRGIPVFCVGKCESFGTWQFHPQVTRLDTLDMAAKIMNEWHQHGAPK